MKRAKIKRIATTSLRSTQAREKDLRSSRLQPQGQDRPVNSTCLLTSTRNTLDVVHISHRDRYQKTYIVNGKEAPDRYLRDDLDCFQQLM